MLVAMRVLLWVEQIIVAGAKQLDPSSSIMEFVVIHFLTTWLRMLQILSHRERQSRREALACMRALRSVLRLPSHNEPVQVALCAHWTMVRAKTSGSPYKCPCWVSASLQG